MTVSKGLLLVFSAAVFVGGLCAGAALQSWGVVRAQSAPRVFELRTYTAPEGKLDQLQARFRDHTLRLFQKHGMTNVGYWVPQDAPASQNTLMYVLAYPSREAAKASWAAFQADPDWQKARTASEVQGRLTTKVESVFMTPSDYSPMK